jgi:phage baseplate assembly protein gpV
MFDLSDAFATPVCRPGGSLVDTVNLVVRLDQASIMISPDGTVVISTQGAAEVTAPAGLTINADITVNGMIEATGDVTGGGVSLMNHLTTNVTPGTGMSGKPAQ